MSLYEDLSRKIHESDCEEAFEILQDLWEQGIRMDRLTACLMGPAAASLQFKFDTPHAMICLDSVLQLLDQIPPHDRLFFLEWYVRYLCGLPKLFFNFQDTEKLGTLGARHAKKAYTRSLLEHKVNNGFYYALRFVEEEGLENYLHHALEIAAHEVDFLGHVFIYTHTVGRLCRLAGSDQTKSLIFQLTEFLARRAMVELGNLLKEGQEMDDLIPLTFERINTLGHNVILAQKICQVADHLEGRYIEHLCSQLVRNIENSPDSFSREDIEELLGGMRDETNDPLGALKKSLARGNDRQGIYYCCRYLENSGLTPELFSTLAKSLASKDPSQPHFIIFPQAAFSLAQMVDAPGAELALARVVQMICGCD